MYEVVIDLREILVLAPSRTDSC